MESGKWIREKKEALENHIIPHLKKHNITNHLIMAIANYELLQEILEEN